MKLAAFALLASPAVLAAGIELASPDRRVTIAVSPAAAGWTYYVSLDGRPVITESRIGVVVDGVDITRSATAGVVQRTSGNSEYPTRGVHSIAKDQFHAALVPVSGPVAANLELRAYNDGVAFRFVVPGGVKPRVPDGASEFKLPAGSAVWHHGFEGHYEGIHKRDDIGAVKAGQWAVTPLTFRLPGGEYGSILESAVMNYSGMALLSDGANGFLERLGHEPPPGRPFTLRYTEEDVKRLARPASIAGTITTPWRIVLAGTLQSLVNSDMVTNLAPAADPKLFPNGVRTDWVRPGRAVWAYLDGGERSVAGMKEFSRLAAELGFEYNVVEGFWTRWSDAELKDFVDDSAKRNVGVILWTHSRDLRQPAIRRALFEKMHRFGVAGFKIDFFDHEAKDMVDLYHAILRDAAENRLVCNFHGASKPGGEARTWPNELTREGIRGLEYRSTPTWASHNTTLPFTRMLAGHADYTPLHFGDRRKETSWAHQIASAAIFTSPLLVFGAHPKTMLEHPAADVIKSIPSTWDATVVLPGSEIGVVAGFARRSGNRWFVAILNGPEARTMKVSLSFLAPGRHAAVVVRDDVGEAASVRKETVQVSAGDALTVEMRAGGGFVARIDPPK